MSPHCNQVSDDTQENRKQNRKLSPQNKPAKKCASPSNPGGTGDSVELSAVHIDLKDKHEPRPRPSLDNEGAGIPAKESCTFPLYIE